MRFGPVFSALVLTVPFMVNAAAADETGAALYNDA